MDFPDPDGPMIATNSPLYTREADAPESLDRCRPFPVDLGQVPHLDERRRVCHHWPCAGAFAPEALPALESSAVLGALPVR